MDNKDDLDYRIVRIWDRAVFKFSKRKNNILKCGRAKRLNDIKVNTTLASREHCVFEHDSETKKTYIMDLDTMNGTYVNGIQKPPKVKIELKSNDTISVGGGFETSNKLQYLIVDLKKVSTQIDDEIEVIYQQPKKEPNVSHSYNEVKAECSKVEDIEVCFDSRSLIDNKLIIPRNQLYHIGLERVEIDPTKPEPLETSQQLNNRGLKIVSIEQLKDTSKVEVDSSVFNTISTIITTIKTDQSEEIHIKTEQNAYTQSNDYRYSVDDYIELSDTEEDFSCFSQLCSEEKEFKVDIDALEMAEIQNKGKFYETIVFTNKPEEEEEVVCICLSSDDEDDDEDDDLEIVNQWKSKLKYDQDKNTNHEYMDQYIELNIGDMNIDDKKFVITKNYYVESNNSMSIEEPKIDLREMNNVVYSEEGTNLAIEESSSQWNNEMPDKQSYLQEDQPGDFTDEAELSVHQTEILENQSEISGEQNEFFEQQPEIFETEEIEIDDKTGIKSEIHDMETDKESEGTDIEKVLEVEVAAESVENGENDENDETLKDMIDICKSCHTFQQPMISNVISLQTFTDEEEATVDTTLNQDNSTFISELPDNETSIEQELPSRSISDDEISSDKEEVNKVESNKRKIRRLESSSDEEISNSQRRSRRDQYANALESMRSKVHKKQKTRRSTYETESDNESSSYRSRRITRSMSRSRMYALNDDLNNVNLSDIENELEKKNRKRYRPQTSREYPSFSEDSSDNESTERRRKIYKKRTRSMSKSKEIPEKTQKQGGKVTLKPSKSQKSFTSSSTSKPSTSRKARKTSTSRGLSRASTSKPKSRSTSKKRMSKTSIPKTPSKVVAKESSSKTPHKTKSSSNVSKPKHMEFDYMFEPIAVIPSIPKQKEKPENVRKIKQIMPLPLKVKTKTPLIKSTEASETSKSTKPEEKIPKKLTKKEMESLDRQKMKIYKKERQRRMDKHKWAVQLPDRMKSPPKFTLAEKREIKDKRKEILAQLELNKKSTSDKKTKPVVKMCSSSRGDLLCADMNKFAAGKSLDIDQDETQVISKKTKNKENDQRTINIQPKDKNKSAPKSILKSILKSANNNVVKRRVTFNIPADPSTSQLAARKRDVDIKKLEDMAISKTMIEQFLLTIYMWNPNWIEEQTKINREPPILNNDELIPLLSTYKSYKEYSSILKPVLLLELWHTLTYEKTAKNSMEMYSKKCLLKSHEIKTITVTRRQKLNYSKFSFDMVINRIEYDMHYHPEKEDLVFFKYNCGRRLCHLFGYVTCLQRVVITSTTVYDEHLKRFVDEPYALVKCEVDSKSTIQLPQADTYVRIKPIMSLRSILKQAYTLQILSSSPLLNKILKPNIENYNLLDMPTTNTNYTLFTKDNLNENQMKAVIKAKTIFCQRQPKIVLIDGLPGTGKSKVVVNIVAEAYAESIKRKSPFKILLCAPTNAAVDELMLRLIKIHKELPTDKKFQIFRLGSPTSIHPSVREFSLTKCAEREIKKTGNFQNKLQHCNQRIAALKITLENAGNHFPIIERQLRRLEEQRDMLLYTDSQTILYVKKCRHFNYLVNNLILKHNDESVSHFNSSNTNIINKELFETMVYIQEKAILKKAQIIVCTLDMCSSKLMESAFGNNGISLCIVDEATRCNEIETLAPLMLGVSSLILVGDSSQIPPIITSKRAKTLGLQKSLFYRIQSTCEMSPNKISDIITLNIQYRMSSSILQWPNEYFFGNQLMSLTTENFTLPICPYLLFNLDSKEESEFVNSDESMFVTSLVYAILSYMDNRPLSIGVITPNVEQMNVIRNQIHEKVLLVLSNIEKKFTVEVNTIEGFQNKENDIIIISCVKSNGISSLSDHRILCTAMTRAKHCLYICGNFNYTQKIATWNALLKDAEARNLIRNMKSNMHNSKIRQIIRFP